MEPRQRTHLVNELMQEVHLMMGVLEKAMQGERIEEGLITGLNLSHDLSFALSWGPLHRGGSPWRTSARDPVPMPCFGTARSSRGPRWKRWNNDCWTCSARRCWPRANWNGAIRGSRTDASACASDS